MGAAKYLADKFRGHYTEHFQELRSRHESMVCLGKLMTVSWDLFNGWDAGSPKRWEKGSILSPPRFGKDYKWYIFVVYTSCQLGDGRTATYCTTFARGTISTMNLLPPKKPLHKPNSKNTCQEAISKGNYSSSIFFLPAFFMLVLWRLLAWVACKQQHLIRIPGFRTLSTINITTHTVLLLMDAILQHLGQSNLIINYNTCLKKSNGINFKRISGRHQPSTVTLNGDRVVIGAHNPKYGKRCGNPITLSISPPQPAHTAASLPPKTLLLADAAPTALDTRWAQNPGSGAAINGRKALGN